MKKRAARLMFVLVLASLNAACLGFLGGGDPETVATVVVRNDIMPATTLTIVMNRIDGGEETLGVVPGGEERTLEYSSEELQGAYQLIARQSSGAAVTSREFTLFEDARVSWQVRSNTLTVTQPR